MAIEAADRLAARGIAVDLLEVSTLKPIDAAALAASSRKTGRVLTVEEHTTIGGLGSAVAESLAQSSPAALRMIGIQDTFTESGDYSALLRKYGISTDHIEAGAMQLVETNPR